MTTLWPGLQTAPATLLDDSQRTAFIRLLDADPIVNAVISSRVQTVGSITARSLGGPVIGVTAGEELTAACYAGGNILPVGGDVEAWERMADFIAARRRACTSLVGPAGAVEVMWTRLARAWGPARTIRAAQPLLLTDRPPAQSVDPEVHVVRPDQLRQYVVAARAMFIEELGMEPDGKRGSAPFQQRVSDLIAQGRAYARVDHRGEVMFKADVGAVSAHTCQIQGVWVRPDLRNGGLGTHAMATVITHALSLAPSVSLYVNDYNTAARRIYDRLGMHQVATFRTVLLR